MFKHTASLTLQFMAKFIKKIKKNNAMLLAYVLITSKTYHYMQSLMPYLFSVK